VYLYQGNDMLMHFCWKDRSNNIVEDDLVLFPDEIEFKKVTQNTTGEKKSFFANFFKRKKFIVGRVYVLKWRSNTRKLFFWMQEPKDDKDEEFCKKINDLVSWFFFKFDLYTYYQINQPPTPGFDDEGSGGAHPLQPLMDRMTGGAGGAGGIDPNDLSNVLRGRLKFSYSKQKQTISS
jgi:26S proteasome regulatory subunit N13